MTNLQQEILSVANSTIGITEKPNNGGWINQPEYEAAMKLQGWIKGQPWCAYHAEYIWLKAYAALKPALFTLVKKYCSGSAQLTAQAYHKSKEFTTSTIKPVLGAIVIWQHGKTPLGHAGIVVEITKEGFWSIEGNTSAEGSREGTIVKKRFHKLNEPYGDNKLNISRFIYPCE